MLLNGCNRLRGRGGAVSWLLWCWATPRYSSRKTSERRSAWSACPCPVGIWISPLRSARQCADVGPPLDFCPDGKRWPTALRLPSKAKLSHRHRPGASKRWSIGAAPAASLCSTGDAGGASALSACPKPSGFVGTAAPAAVRTSTADHQKVAGIRAFLTLAPLAFEAGSGCPVRRPLKCLDA